MSSTFGKNIKISIWGQSHSAAIGVTVDGLPAGFKIDENKLGEFLARRAPGQGKHTTSRKEADTPEILSGVVDGVTCGAPLSALIRNTDCRSGDYSNIADIPRPGHADYTAQIKYSGYQDVRGGGHFSGRLTAPLCIAGGICLQILEEKGIRVSAEIKSIGKVKGTLDEMYAEIEKARMACDSVGGVIECRIAGVPAGVGDPMFDGIENRIAKAVFGIPAVKGIEFGRGFEAATMYGSEHNDPYRVNDGKITPVTNNHGGILGGISSGEDIVFRVAVKPTASILKSQESVSLSRLENAELKIVGRHDPCIVPRALPCVEAAAAIAIYDLMLDADI